MVSDDLAEFREQMTKDQREFETKIESKFDAFAEKVNSKIDKLTAEVVVLQRDGESFKHDVHNLFDFNYWILSIIVVLIAMPQISAGLKSLFEVITNGVAGIISLFGQKKD